MDRTEEYNSMILRTRISQIRSEKTVDKFLVAFKEFKDELSPTDSKYLTNRKIESIERIINFLREENRAFKEITYGSEDEKKFLEDVNSAQMMTIFQSKTLLKKYNEQQIKREKETAFQEFSEKSDMKGNYGNPSNSESKPGKNFQKESETIKRRDTSKKFDKINSQITEISSIMEEMTMHIKMQGETVKRIEELRISTSSHISDGYLELKKKWESVSSRRKIITKFGILWLFIIFFFFGLKKIF